MKSHWTFLSSFGYFFITSVKIFLLYRFPHPQPFLLVSEFTLRLFKTLDWLRHRKEFLFLFLKFLVKRDCHSSSDKMVSSLQIIAKRVLKQKIRRIIDWTHSGMLNTLFHWVMLFWDFLQILFIIPSTSYHAYLTISADIC